MSALATEPVISPASSARADEAPAANVTTAEAIIAPASIFLRHG